jgi:vacuolar-type H+-ATPase catalytic subunit A/Vma1
MGLVKSNKSRLEEFVDLDEQLSDVRSKYSIKVIANMLEMLSTALNNLKEDNNKKVFYDKDLGENIKSMIKEVGKILFNLSEQQNISNKTMADTITKQNSLIIKLLENISDKSSNKSEKLLILTNQMLIKNNEFLENGLKVIDYSNSLKGIEKAISNRPLEWEFKVERDNKNDINKVIATAKN